MDVLGRVRTWIAALTEIALMLLALAIALSLLVGSKMSFFDGVVGNLVNLVSQLGQEGLVGLIVLGLILWLFSKRSIS
jgi:hypothetical protein